MTVSRDVAGKRVCVIGSGISGLSAAWLLKNAGAHVTLLEREENFGGHTLTDSTTPYPVDLGFQVFNYSTYPHLVGLFETLGVDSEPSDMSFSLSLDNGALEWGSDGLKGLFAQKSNLFSLSFLGMVRDVMRFGREAPEVLQPSKTANYSQMTLGEYLSSRRYSEAFIANYVVPMCAAVWSVPAGQVLDFPVQSLVRFWVNHHLLDIFQRPVWRVVKGRAKTYVERIVRDLDDARTACPVVAVRRVGELDGFSLLRNTTETAVKKEKVVAATAGTTNGTAKVNTSATTSSAAGGGSKSSKKKKGGKTGGGGVANGVAATAETSSVPSDPTLPLSVDDEAEGVPPPSSSPAPLKTPDGFVLPRASPVQIDLESGETLSFDAVILATHTDTALQLLGSTATETERRILSSIPYADNHVVLHSDASLMPKRRDCWTSWNFLGKSGGEKDEVEGGDLAAHMSEAPVCVTYWLNRLQNLPASAPNLFVTLNPIHPPREDLVHRRLILSHPVYSSTAVAAQSQLSSIQGHGEVYFCGAWAGYGFHEDGVKAALDVVQRLGVSQLPWVPRSLSPKIGWWDGWLLSAFDTFARAAIKQGMMRIILPNGAEKVYGSAAAMAAAYTAAGKEADAWRGRPPLSATLRIHSWDFFSKIITRHDTGLGESYMDDDFTVDNVGGLMAVITANAGNIEQKRGLLGWANRLGDRALHLAHLARANTIEGARRNIEEHYDAGNAMYQLFLDESMMYSSAMHRAEDKNLFEAQMRKLDAIIRKGQLQKGDHVLEIGCGWGAFAIRAVQTTGCKVTGVTLSKEQLAIASERVREAGLEDSITFLLQDYRDLHLFNQFDKVVSIEMIEAVGHEHLPDYFQIIGKALKKNGIAVLQAISEPDGRYDAYCRSSDFIREHIFPGGHLPSIGAMVESMRGTGMRIHHTEDIGLHYAVTLRAWRSAWERNRENVLALGYSDRFWRKYNFYFAYCEAAFDARYIHNFHVVLVKDQEENGKVQAAATRAFATWRPMKDISTMLSRASGVKQHRGGSKSESSGWGRSALVAVGVVAAGAAVWSYRQNKPTTWEDVLATARAAGATALETAKSAGGVAATAARQVAHAAHTALPASMAKYSPKLNF